MHMHFEYAITDLWRVFIFLLITNTFNGSIESIVVEMDLNECFCSYYVNKMWKDAFLLTVNFHY